jgi:hypothetical protein
LRCKIVKTKELSANSSRKRSYGTFFALPVSASSNAARKRRAGTITGRKTAWNDCAANEENNLQTTCGGANRSLFARIGILGFPPISQRT